jgi:superfamily I DNA/RNA helicase
MRAVKELDSCVALIAGPGAGKTEVLAQRADFLLRTGSCRYPKRILAISFKTDASKNLKDRVRLRSGADLASRFDSYTFHGFAKRIVDRFRPVLTDESALPYNYTIGNEHKPNQQITFSQLIPLAIRILTECTRARNAINQTYKHVFLDEFQDCTADQYALIRLLFAQPQTLLTAVGDTKQKITAFSKTMLRTSKPSPSIFTATSDLSLACFVCRTRSSEFSNLKRSCFQRCLRATKARFWPSISPTATKRPRR